ncbi:MAG: hypothetical protein Q7U98_08405 [Methylicorpusculum sp.]|uniref:hypothetical protein n=1 Tax=Methylicorpusculum sp. TaxID=2713644 RepID=UPI0027177918|nr:hypothetical protein [Methylicorpusculum sp.]MDO8939169.1 hypothetical protein [Methylicorpusculum sp.]MDP2179180.1 hypothetical protein [Methylicorpusculum sp.]MDP2201506.1 hypothetical protein [Methylicorpusculum sp.]
METLFKAINKRQPSIVALTGRLRGYSVQSLHGAFGLSSSLRGAGGTVFKVEKLKYKSNKSTYS